MRSKATNHQIKQAMIRLINCAIQSEVIETGGVSVTFRDKETIWISTLELCPDNGDYFFIKVDKDLSVNVTKTILKIKKLLRDTAHSN